MLNNGKTSFSKMSSGGYSRATSGYDSVSIQGPAFFNSTPSDDKFLSSIKFGFWGGFMKISILKGYRNIDSGKVDWENFTRESAPKIPTIYLRPEHALYAAKLLDEYIKNREDNKFIFRAGYTFMSITNGDKYGISKEADVLRITKINKDKVVQLDRVYEFNPTPVLENLKINPDRSVEYNEEVDNSERTELKLFKDIIEQFAKTSSRASAYWQMTSDYPRFDDLMKYVSDKNKGDIPPF